MKKSGRRKEKEKEEVEAQEDGTKEEKVKREKEDIKGTHQEDGIKEGRAMEAKEDTSKGIRTMDTKEEREKLEEEKETCIGAKEVTKIMEAQMAGTKPKEGTGSCSASRVYRFPRHRD